MGVIFTTMTVIHMNLVNGNKVHPDGQEAYANSQLYTDWLLQQIYTYGKEKIKLLQPWCISLTMVKAWINLIIQIHLTLL